MKTFPNRRFGIEFELQNDQTKQEVGQLIEQFESNTNKQPVVVTPEDRGWSQTKDNNYWHVKRDRTCGRTLAESGWEIATYIASGDHDLKHITDCFKFLFKNGIATNQNCGLHIHADTSDFEPYQVGTLLARWMKIEGLLTNICSVHRHRNPHCSSLFKKSMWATLMYNEDMIQFWNYMSPKSFEAHENLEKKYTLNTIGFALAQTVQTTRNTIELRLPEAIPKSVHVKNWTVLYLNFVEQAKIACPPKTLIPVKSVGAMLEYVGLEGALDETLNDCKSWLLQKIIRSGFTKQVYKKQAEKILQSC